MAGQSGSASRGADFVAGIGANTHLSLIADDDLLQVAQKAVATREESLRLTRLRFEHQIASQLVLSQPQSLLEGAKVALTQAKRQRTQDDNALALLVGQTLPSDLLTRRPDVRQAEQQLLASNANIGAACAAFFPRLTLTGSAGIVGNDLERLFSAGTSAWTFAPQALLPIFDAGRNQASLDAAKVGRDIAVAQYEKTIQTAFREVADALAARATLTEQLRAQKAQLTAEETRMALVELRERQGLANALEVLDARRSLFAAQQAALQTQAQQLQSLVTVYKVLGGGWSEPVVRKD